MITCFLYIVTPFTVQIFPSTFYHITNLQCRYSHWVIGSFGDKPHMSQDKDMRSRIKRLGSYSHVSQHIGEGSAVYRSNMKSTA